MKTDYDVIIIGAGINGAGIARDAAMRGLRVLLIDKGDIGSGTSAASTRPWDSRSADRAGALSRISSTRPCREP